MRFVAGGGGRRAPRATSGGGRDEAHQWEPPERINLNKTHARSRRQVNNKLTARNDRPNKLYDYGEDDDDDDDWRAVGIFRLV